MTPLRFTPFARQAVSNHRFQRPGSSEPISSFGFNQRQGEESAASSRGFTYRLNLSETIRSNSNRGVGGIFQSLGLKQSLYEKPYDNFKRFSEMYQWLKESINECSFKQIQVGWELNPES